MSAKSFIGPVYFQAFLRQISPLIAPHSPLAHSISLADVRFPDSEEAAAAFTQRCLLSMKKKADLLGKIYPGKLRRTESLDLVANACFFPHWKGFLEYLESFPKLSQSQRKTSGDTIKLCSCLWKIPENQFDEFFMGYFATSGMVLAEQTGLELDKATEITRKLFSDSGASQSNEFMSAQDMTDFAESFHDDPAAKYVEDIILNHRFSSTGQLLTPSELEKMPVSDLIKSEIIYDTSMGSMPTSVIEMMIAYMMSDVHKYAESNLTLSSPERKEIIKRLASDQSRMSTETAIRTMFAKEAGMTVYKLLMRDK